MNILNIHKLSLVATYLRSREANSTSRTGLTWRTLSTDTAKLIVRNIRSPNNVKTFLGSITVSRSKALLTAIALDPLRPGGPAGPGSP